VALIIIAIGIVGTFPFSPRQSALLSFLTAGIPAIALAAWARPARVGRGSTLGGLANFAAPAGLTVTLVGLLLFAAYCVPIFELAADDAVTIREINAALKETLPQAQTALTYFLTVCGLLLVVFVDLVNQTNNRARWSHSRSRPPCRPRSNRIGTRVVLRKRQRSTHPDASNRILPTGCCDGRLLQLRVWQALFSCGTHPDCQHIHGGPEAGRPLQSYSSPAGIPESETTSSKRSSG
jgi:hypothetical protein